MAPHNFRKFRHDWKSYKESYSLPPATLRNYLYQCCSQDVQTAIFASCPKFLEPTLTNPADDENAALDFVQGIATCNAHPLVHQIQFWSITQSKGESCKDFLSRLRVAAPDCDFMCPNANCRADLSRTNIRNQFVRGVYNNTLQAMLLKSASANPNVDLETLVLEASNFEQSIRDQQVLASVTPHMPAPSVQAVESPGYPYAYQGEEAADDPAVLALRPRQGNYQGNRSNQRWSNQQRRPKPCKGCGSTDHTSAKREKKCPKAYIKK